MKFEEAVTVEEVTERRWYRVGACPVLEVSVTYPHLTVREGAEGEISPVDVGRFNDAYARMAEAFLPWAEGDPAREAAEAFGTMGAGAAYRFDRRLVLCKMTVSSVQRSPSDTVGYVRVVRRVSMGRRREEEHEKNLLHEDIWRFPDMTLVRRCPRGLAPLGDESRRGK